MTSKFFFDANQHPHTNEPDKIGGEVDVTVRPANQASPETSVNEDEQFLIAAYSATTPEEAGEDATWEKYVGA